MPSLFLPSLTLFSLSLQGRTGWIVGKDSGLLALSLGSSKKDFSGWIIFASTHVQMAALLLAGGHASVSSLMVLNTPQCYILTRGSCCKTALSSLQGGGMLYPFIRMLSFILAKSQSDIQWNTQSLWGNLIKPQSLYTSTNIVKENNSTPLTFLQIGSVETAVFTLTDICFFSQLSLSLFFFHNLLHAAQP